jgi:hypothetical protein
MRLFIYVEKDSKLLRLPLVRLQHTHNVVYPTCSLKLPGPRFGGRVGINRGRKASYFTRHFGGFPALIPWFSTGSMVSLIPSFITYLPI